MAKNFSIDLLAEIAEEHDLDVRKIKIKKIPAKVKNVLNKWLRAAKVPAATLKKKVLRASFANDRRQYYVFTFQATKPKPYKGKVIVHGNLVVGESSTRPGLLTHHPSRPKQRAANSPKPMAENSPQEQAA
jgi:hypothetical protein